MRDLRPGISFGGLLVAVGLLTIWVRSMYVADSVGDVFARNWVLPYKTGITVKASNGGIEVKWLHVGVSSPKKEPEGWVVHSDPHSSLPWWEFGVSDPMDSERGLVRVPMWVLIVVAVTPGVLWVRRRRREKRRGFEVELAI